MKRTLMVVRILVQAAGLTALAMASLGGLVFMLYCLVTLSQLTFWGAVIPAAIGLFAAFCGFLFAARELEAPEAHPTASANEARLHVVVRPCKPMAAANAAAPTPSRDASQM